MTGRSARAEGLFIAVLGLSCAVLAVLQFRWTGQITRDERDRARAQLENRLDNLRGDFNAALFQSLDGALGHRGGPQDRFPAAPPCLFSGSRFLVRGGGTVQWLAFDANGRLEPSSAPDGMGDAFRFLDGLPPGEAVWRDGFIVRDARGFGPGERGRGEPPGNAFPPPRMFQIARLDVKCLDQDLLPGLIEDQFGSGEEDEYEFRVVSETHGGETNAQPVFQSSPQAATLTAKNADAAIPLLSMRPNDPGRGDGHGGGRFGGGPPRFFPPPSRGAAQGGLLLLARHKSGSLDAMVASERKRNLAASGALLLLIVAAGIALIRFARGAQRVSELRMNIVAGVSHELRSPLAVIRTAAFNLQREGFSPRPEQVRRYGELIGAESTRLERLIDNVLQFAAGSAAQASKERALTYMAELIDCELQFLRDVIAAAGMTVDRDIAAHLPPVAADGGALRHAIRNVLENAIKYGKAGGWIGISARASGNQIVIRIADRGPGIPAAESARIFEPFFRGAHAIGDQVHGAGLGLSLAHQIVKAHGGTIAVDEEYREGAGFLIGLPAAHEAGAPA